MVARRFLGIVCGVGALAWAAPVLAEDAGDAGDAEADAALVVTDAPADGPAEAAPDGPASDAPPSESGSPDATDESPLLADAPADVTAADSEVEDSAPGDGWDEADADGAGANDGAAGDSAGPDTGQEGGAGTSSGGAAGGGGMAAGGGSGGYGALGGGGVGGNGAYAGTGAYGGSGAYGAYGGSGGLGGASGAAGSGHPILPAPSAPIQDAGCGCQVPAGPERADAWWVLGAGLALSRRRLRRR